METKKELLDLIKLVESKPIAYFDSSKDSVKLLEAYILRYGPVDLEEIIDLKIEYNLWFGLEQNILSTLSHLKQIGRLYNLEEDQQRWIHAYSVQKNIGGKK